ncbi:MAG: hypothetical protein ABSB94_08405 [Syntrophorhabdales bacterium]
MRTMIGLVLLLIFSSGAFAQTQTMDDRIKTLEETLKKQEQTVQELKNLQETLKKQEQAIEDQRKLIEQLKIEIAHAQVQAPAPAAGNEAKAAMAPAEVQRQVQELTEKVEQVAETQKKFIPSVFNPSIGFVGETLFSYNNRPLSQTGNGSGRPGGYDVNLRSVELNAAASVDPFARGYIVLNADVDPITGDATTRVEEASIVTTSLPWNLTVQGGRFFGEFGRLGYIHDHELPFVNRPMVLDQYIGGESRTDGVQINYLLPIPHYVSLTMGAGTQFGGTTSNVSDFRPFGGLAFWGRSSTYFDLTPNISLEPGISGLLNPKTDSPNAVFTQPDGSTFTERERRLAGADLVLAYRPLQNNQFKSVTWGTEVLKSSNRYDVTTSDGSFSNRTVGSLGLYSYLAYRFHRQWTVGFLYEWLENAQNNQARTSAYSPYITWYLSHWNQLRLQYTHTDNNVATGLKPSDAVYLQWAWIIGSHAHGWQQR